MSLKIIVVTDQIKPIKDMENSRISDDVIDLSTRKYTDDNVSICYVEPEATALRGRYADLIIVECEITRKLFENILLPIVKVKNSILFRYPQDF